MLWLGIAVATAFFTAAGDALVKHYLRPFGTAKMALARVLAPIFFLLPLLLLQPWPPLDRVFWRTVLILLPLETTALLCYMEALRVSPLSLTVPFLAFTPAFMIVTGALILGEHLNTQGILGIFLIVCGSYALHLNTLHQGLLAPFRAILRERGSLLMLLVAFLYAITSVLGKLAVQHSSPFFFACFYFVVHGVFAVAVLRIFFRVRPLELIRLCPRGVLLVGLAQSAMVICHMWAISLAPAAYMIAVKRLSVLFGVLMGGLVFREEALASRLLGAVLMLAGVFLIALS
ncbi:MAG: EamA family transporter [Thermodesulfobacteria bacterium]|nr:EamA family transporter [Thermodesulfobacteriota bacterium]